MATRSEAANTAHDLAVTGTGALSASSVVAVDNGSLNELVFYIGLRKFGKNFGA